MLFRKNAFVFLYFICYSKISLLNMSEKFPPSLFCCNNFNLSRSSLGFSDENFVEFPEAMIAGDSSDFIGEDYRVNLLPGACTR